MPIRLAAELTSGLHPAVPADFRQCPKPGLLLPAPVIKLGPQNTDFSLLPTKT
jgi:hypothetical protein